MGPVCSHLRISARSVRGLYKDIQGEVAYTAWTMGDVVPFGTDTFIIRNGKIQVQTVGMYMP